MDTEMLIVANEKGYKIKEIPVLWQETRKSRINLYKDIFDTKFRSYFDFWIKTNTSVYYGYWNISSLSFFQSNSDSLEKNKLSKK